MEFEKIIRNNKDIVHVIDERVVISDAQSAIDLMMTVNY